MKIYPSIDLINNQMVRLYQGDPGKKTIFKKDYSDLIKMLTKWISYGMKDLHIVDLDRCFGKKLNDSNIYFNSNDLERLDQIDQKNRNKFLIEKILNVFSDKCNIQLAGGINSLTSAQHALSLGANKVVIGSMAALDVDTSYKIINSVGADKVTIACDVKYANAINYNLKDLTQYHVYCHGWQYNSKLTIIDVIERFYRYDLVFLITDISKDGTMQGANFQLYQAITKMFPNINYIVSGGVKDLDDISKASQTKAYGCILGRSLHQGCYNLKDALQC